MSMENQGRVDLDVEDIISDINDLVRDRPDPDKVAILEQIRRGVIVDAPAVRAGGPTIESLYVWDLLSKSAYRDLQFMLNEEPLAGIIAWEDRTTGLIERMFARSDRVFSTWAPARTAELAFALDRVACRSSRTAAWCDAMLGCADPCAKARTVSTDAYERRRACSESKLAMRHLRKVEGLTVKMIAQRYALSIHTVRDHIAQANELHARRLLTRDPAITARRSDVAWLLE